MKKARSGIEGGERHKTFAPASKDGEEPMRKLRMNPNKHNPSPTKNFPLGKIWNNVKEKYCQIQARKLGTCMRPGLQPMQFGKPSTSYRTTATTTTTTNNTTHPTHNPPRTLVRKPITTIHTTSDVEPTAKSSFLYKTSKCAEIISKKCQTVAADARKTRYQQWKAKFNGGTNRAKADMFKQLRNDRTPPATILYDQKHQTHTANLKRMHECIQEEHVGGWRG